MIDPLAAWRVGSEPFYQPQGDECDRFEAVWSRRLPLLLKGPTGCGKTRFLEHMAWRMGRPLVTVACNEDTTAGDLLGRWLLDAEGTRWQDGPLALAARHGAICYLDEVVEARPDALVAVHPLTDTRRVLPLDCAAEMVRAHPDFMLVASYNPGGTRELKPSTRQRFCGMAFGYPEAEDEARILMREGGADVALASALVALGRRTRRLAGHGLEEGASTRMLVRAAQLARQGLSPEVACVAAIVVPLSDDAALRDALLAAVDASF
ncbi:CbbQ/NirQ/NorQ/GpvN family protein [Variovorax sp. OV329]|uniref:CbbQ/NirQ/NorQ/GpvN family protein n=1 Tax=Variovorax sp. OV329 TaxID=1882825 RepID=UPI0008EFFDE6|nr:CbbQ/NirQ/NorQ/GpvN family protein [Variovorax sp. OV329]SFM42470.1 nitric oxide reductase NorQ protein [Variovorax sp. OV329]